MADPQAVNHQGALKKHQNSPKSRNFENHAMQACRVEPEVRLNLLCAPNENPKT